MLEVRSSPRRPSSIQRIKITAETQRPRRDRKAGTMKRLRENPCPSACIRGSDKAKRRERRERGGKTRRLLEHPPWTAPTCRSFPAGRHVGQCKAGTCPTHSETFTSLRLILRCDGCRCVISGNFPADSGTATDFHSSSLPSTFHVGSSALEVQSSPPSGLAPGCRARGEGDLVTFRPPPDWRL